MNIQDLYQCNFIGGGTDSVDTVSANNAIMIELGKIIGNNRNDFIDLLKESDIPANDSMSDAKLIELFVTNASINKELLLGAAMLVAMNNSSKSGFDGDFEVNNNGVKNAYIVMNGYFTAGDDEDGFSGFLGGAIATAVGQSAKFGSDIVSSKRNKEYGVMDSVQKQNEAKNAITQQLIAQRQTQIESLSKEKEAKQKTTRTVLIVGGVVVSIVLVAGIFYILKTRKS
jgi:hypothetical protein